MQMINKVGTIGLRDIPGFLLASFLALPISIGLPVLFWTLLGRAVKANDSGGGMFYFPSEPNEILFALLFFLFSLPFLISSFILAFPVSGIMDLLNIEFSLVIPVMNGTVTYGGSAFITMIPGVLIQILAWGALFFFIWSFLRFIIFNLARSAQE
jgi:hypothetical protein